jgi:hypothetical protein
VCQDYRNIAGIDGVLLEYWPLELSNNEGAFFSRSSFLASLAFIDSLTSIGLGVLGVGQNVTDDPAEVIRYVYGAILIAQSNNMLVQGRFIYGYYANHKTEDLNLLTLGRPVGSRRYDDNGTWERDYGGVGVDGVTRINATVRLFIPTGTVSVSNPPVLTILRDGIKTTDFVLGFTRPDATNTGVPAELPLTVLNPANAVYETTADNQIIENLDINAFIFVKHNNVTIRNCRVRGRDTGDGFIVSGSVLPATPSGSPVGDGVYARAMPTAPSNPSVLVRGLVYTDTTVPVTGLLVERCTLIPDYPSWWCYGVYVRGGATVSRCNIANCGDAISVRGGANTIIGNYIHDSILFDNDFDQRGSSPAWWSHNDGISVFSGSGTVIRGNNINSKMTGARTGVMAAAGYADLQYGSSITVSPSSSTSFTVIKNLTIDKNWLSGGAACIQANALNTTYYPGDDNVVGVITGNRVARDGHDFGSNSTYQIRYASAVMFTQSGNVWDSDPATVAYNATNTSVAIPGATLTVGFTGGIRIP